MGIYLGNQRVAPYFGTINNGEVDGDGITEEWVEEYVAGQVQGLSPLVHSHEEYALKSDISKPTTLGITDDNEGNLNIMLEASSSTFNVAEDSNGKIIISLG